MFKCRTILDLTMNLALVMGVFTLRLPAQQTQQYSLMGEIRIANGLFPSRRIEVLLETRGALVGTTYADNEGKFSFSQLVPNVYYVVINDSEFEPIRLSYEIRELSGSNNYVQVTLAQRQQQEPISKPPISGANPFLANTQELVKHYNKKAISEFQKGNKAQQQGKREEAILHFDKAISLAPEFYEAHNNLGLVYLASMDFAHAEKQFAEVVQLNPSDGQGYFNLGNSLLLNKHFTEAAQAIQQGLDRRPDSAFGKLLLGTVYSRTGDRLRAEKLFQDCLSMDAAMAQARLELVNLYVQQNRREEAISELRTFLTVAPRDPFAPKAQEVLNRLERQTQTP